VDAYGIDCLDIHDVEVATSIHQHLAKMLLVDDQIDNERVLAQMQNVVWVVGAVEGDGGP
jgi:hypothetical protein